MMSEINYDIDAARAETKRFSIATENQTESVRNILLDCPVPYTHFVPPGYILRDEIDCVPSILRQAFDKEGNSKNIPVCQKPIVIRTWYHNRTTNTRMLEVGWLAKSKWRWAIVEKARLADSGKIIDALSNKGFPVHSGNKTEIVKYLAAYEAVNLTEFKVKEISEQMGWQEDGEFICGKQSLNGNTEFYGADDGDNHLGETIQSKGTLEGWFQAVRGLEKYSKVELAIYASLASTMLDILDAPNFVVDWSYSTSSGKTTTLRVAASVWGCPDESGPKSIIASWDATSTWLERAAAVRNHLPLIIDETKRAPSYGGVSTVPTTLYKLANGQGRGRGTIRGSQTTRYWKTIVLSTGEQRIVDFSKDGGTAARCLCVWGNPFEEKSNVVSNFIENLNDGLLENYGFIGPEFVKNLIKNKKTWEEYKQRYKKIVVEFKSANIIKDLGVSSRVLKYMATIELTAQLAHEFFKFPWKYNSPIKDLYLTLCYGVAETDRATEAYDCAVEFFVGNQQLFEGARKSSDHEQNIPNQWFGSYKEQEEHDKNDCAFFDTVYFLPKFLKKHLHECGHDLDSIIRIWKERDLIVCSGKRLQKQGRINDKPTWCYALKIKKYNVEKVGNGYSIKETKDLVVTENA